MRALLFAGAGGLLLATGAARPVAPDDGPLPPSTLAVVADGRATTWWRSARAPAEWRAPLSIVTDAIRWHDLDSAVSWGEISLRGSGEGWHTGVVVVRIDPRRIALRLDFPPADASPAGWLGPPRWSIADAPAPARVALNAGQFTAGGAWGWLVRDGREVQPPRIAPLAPAIVVDTAGAVRIVDANAILAARHAAHVAQAFQSYPALLAGGRVPATLQRPGRGIDVAHRDARLALGVLPDGRVLVALTRFEGLGGMLDRLPFGLTTPEMAAVMGALGCHDAVLLDGGVSGQLLVRDASGMVRRWPGLRDVPVGLIGMPR